MPISLSPATWNSLGLGVAATWAALGIAGGLRPAAAADLFGITALGSGGRGDYKSGADRDSMVGFAGVLASRDATIALALLYLGRAGRNADMGAVILSTMTVTVVDVWLVWRKKGFNAEMAVLTAGSLIWAVIGFGLRGHFD
ncbi:hypothetical protein JDV02_007192 [Purpureocillium takamizusanense]|uniref:Uncharacterized protein n=1 Tax=Purpureocillium takamizusanense TaxID=2060973 RepID=A0A9Q8QKB3_9HYPO|nr:uncharacterized protein JDV02_007192 [Purpureocillium takamizusanense]UNI21180.1 hypothetical protein JDV02_007192 [Purpureocillium takamizusanense]